MASTKPFNTKAFVIGALRRASYRTPMRYRALNAAKVAYGRYVCAQCQLVHARKDIQVDHIEPVVPVTGWDSFGGFIERLFCDPSALQILCKTCHKAKSKQENAQRRGARKSNTDVQL